MVEKTFLLKLVHYGNFGAAFLMLLSAIIRFTQFGKSSNPFFYVMTFYLLAFAALMVVAELKVNRVLIYIEFLNGVYGKATYMLFVGLLLFDDERKSDLAIAIVIILTSFFNIIVGCMRDKKPSDRDREDNDHEYNQADEDMARFQADRKQPRED